MILYSGEINLNLSLTQLNVTTSSMFDLFPGGSGVLKPQSKHSVAVQDACYPNPCANGGYCRNWYGNFFCKCAPGFTGRHCQSGMYVCVCMCVYCMLYVCMYVYVCMYYMCVCMYACMHACMDVWMCGCMCYVCMIIFGVVGFNASATARVISRR